MLREVLTKLDDVIVKHERERHSSLVGLSIIAADVRGVGQLYGEGAYDENIPFGGPGSTSQTRRSRK